MTDTFSPGNKRKLAEQRAARVADRQAQAKRAKLQPLTGLQRQLIADAKWLAAHKRQYRIRAACPEEILRWQGATAEQGCVFATIVHHLGGRLHHHTFLQACGPVVDPGDAMLSILVFSAVTKWGRA
jgi:hypothetical protein